MTESSSETVNFTSHSIKRALHLTTGRLLKKIFIDEYNEYDPHNAIATLQERLLQQPDADLICFANHISVMDGHLLNDIANRITPPKIDRQIFRTISLKGTSESPLRRFVWSTLGPMTLGYELIPVIKKRDEELYGVSSDFNKNNFWRRLLEAYPGYTLVGFPGRYAGEKMREAKHGYATIARERGENTLMLPIAISQSNHPSLKTPAREMSVSLGSPFTVAESNTQNHEALTDFMMKRVAEMLPEDMRGYYQ